jgi:PAS domain S-box-containing protein
MSGDLAHELAASQKKLAETERRFRMMADCAPVLLWMAGKDALCDFFNEGWMQFTGRSMDEELGNGWAEGVHPEDFQRCMDQYMSSFVARRPFSMEYRLRRHDGQYRWIYDQGVPRFEPDGAFAGYIGSCVDVTDAREVREAFRAAVMERDVLLRELHHRVKNSLQLISSMLNMQSRQISHERSRNALEECQDRIQTIALIHERLHQSTDLAHVSFRTYTERLTSHILHTARPSGSDVGLELEIDDLFLPVDRAIPCGLIINELLTNALKHAFPGNRSGSVTISLKRLGDDKLALVVRDDGVGLAPDIDVNAAATLGLQLVSTLAEQLNGDLRIERARGTTFQMTFEIGE